MDQAAASNTAEINLEFLQNALKIPIEKFVVNPGSVAGDGYTCMLYSVDVWKSGETEAQHLLVKCFPADVMRQSFLEESRMFAVELGVYQTVVPELIRFQEDTTLGLEANIKLPLAPFHAGRIVSKEQQDGAPNLLDSFIIMTDLRKSGGFRLQDRFQGLDLDHIKLVVEAHATLHAVSWAYKVKRGVPKLLQKFPLLSTKGFQKTHENGVEDYFKQQLEVGANLFKDDATLTAGYEHLRSVFGHVPSLYNNFEIHEGEKSHTKDSILRKLPATVENEEPWEVLLHGDAWSNNILFRYDPITGKPVEIVLVDLQLCREGDPFSDVTYALYSSTNEDMRKKHLSSLLYIYYDTFTEICRSFSVPTLPGWSWEEVNRRFHRAQIFGVYMASTLLPLMLKSPDEIVDMSKMDFTFEDMQSEEFKNSERFKEIMAEFLSMKKPNPVLERRLRGVIGDAVRAGVI